MKQQRLYKKIIGCIVIGGIFNCTYAQHSKKVDSIQQLLQLHKKNDKIKVNLLNTAGYEYWIIDPNKSINFGKEALQLSKKIAYVKGCAKANRIIGVAYWAEGDLVKALEYLNASHETYEKIRDKIGIANTKLNIGMIYADLKEYDKALGYYDQAIHNFTTLGLTSRIATTFTKSGTVFIAQHKYDKAFQYLTSALKMHSKNNFTYGIAEAHNRLGILYLNKNEIELAKYHIKQSMLLGSKINDIHGLANNHIVYGKILRLSKHFDKAATELNKGLKLAKKSNLKKYELLGYEELKKLNKAQYKLEEALFFYEKYNLLKDSLFNSEKTKQIAYLEFKNNLKIKDKELLALKTQEKQNSFINFILTLSATIIFICGIIISIILRQRHKKHKELLQSQYNLSIKDLENSKLKQQQLKKQLDFKNKELMSYALNFRKKREIVNQLQKIIHEIEEGSCIEKSKLIDDLNKLVQKNFRIERDWDDFSKFLDDANQGFYSKIKSIHNDLSANDLKICSMIRLNLSIKETANILKISPESVKTARYRLRKKLGLSLHQKTFCYLINLEQEFNS